VNAETIKAASDAVKPLLEKLGNLGLQGFELAVRQQYVYAISYTLVVVFFVTMFVAALRYHNGAWAHYKEGEPKANWFDWADFDGFLPVVVLSVATLALVICLAVVAEPTIGRIVNPRWYALKDIISLIP
jgi:amino acid transporter